ncbi:MAG: hypothetical protein EOO88_43655 [Pedobacter sp.]|nr:MAG: hypothetical protein EOO88_43655 [Pedobacter sp.]
MKKVFLSILTILYMTVSSGVAMEIHFCMGKKAGTDFYKTGERKCGLCGMKEKKGCCSDEHKFFKLEDAHKNVSQYDLLHPDMPALVPVTPLYQQMLLAQQTILSANSTHAPPGTGQKIYLLNRVFRI